MSAPCDAKNLRDVADLRESVWIGQAYWMHISHTGSVVLCQQRSGKPDVASITIPRRTFRAMLAWYEREQEPSDK